uniref:Ig-like domain-containing protein n=1 Tax=Oreochromis niloticus TaxID=8128 RepID=A0A669F398_ORENI
LSMVQQLLTCSMLVMFLSFTGQNISLPCGAPTNNKQILAVQWSRADLKEKYVLLYRDEVFVPDNQHPAFKNRVDLQDRQMKDGDVSLILKNVTAADNGTYECRVFRRGTNHRISTISLSVVPPCELLKGRFCNRRLYLLHCFYTALSAFVVIITVIETGNFSVRAEEQPESDIKVMKTSRKLTCPLQLFLSRGKISLYSREIVHTAPKQY